MQNMQNLVKYATHICCIYLIYAHIILHISSVCNFEWWKIIIMIINRPILQFWHFWLYLFNVQLQIPVIISRQKYLTVSKQRWTRKMLKKCDRICGNMRHLWKYMQIFWHAAYAAWFSYARFWKCHYIQKDMRYAGFAEICDHICDRIFAYN